MREILVMKEFRRIGRAAKISSKTIKIAAVRVAITEDSAKIWIDVDAKD